MDLHRNRWFIEDKWQKKRLKLNIDKGGTTAPHSCEAGGWKLQVARSKEQNDGVMGAVLSHPENA